jgi:hypothetical protein
VAAVPLTTLSLAMTAGVRRRRADVRAELAAAPAWARQGGGFRVVAPAEVVQLQTGMISVDEYRERVRLNGYSLNSAPSSADMYVPCEADNGTAAVRAAGTSTADMADGFARLGAVLGPCAHKDAEPVDLLVTGERVAWTCPDCPARLPADWRS